MQSNGRGGSWNIVYNPRVSSLKFQDLIYMMTLIVFWYRFKMEMSNTLAFILGYFLTIHKCKSVKIFFYLISVIQIRWFRTIHKWVFIYFCLSCTLVACFDGCKVNFLRKCSCTHFSCYYENCKCKCKWRQSMYIRTVTSYHLVPALLNWFNLVYELFGQSNMHCTLDFFTEQPGRNQR